MRHLNSFYLQDGRHRHTHTHTHPKEMGPVGHLSASCGLVETSWFGGGEGGTRTHTFVAAPSTRDCALQPAMHQRTKTKEKTRDDDDPGPDEPASTKTRDPPRPALRSLAFFYSFIVWGQKIAI